MNLTIAWRNLWRHPRRTLVILLAVIVGVWAMVFYAAFIRGMMVDMLRQGIANLTGHVQVQAPGFFENPVIDARIRDVATVRDALGSLLPEGARWTSRLRTGAVVRSPHGAYGVTLVGVDPAAEHGMSFLADSVTEGSGLANAPHGLLVGRALLVKLEARTGHRLVIDAQDASGQIVSRAFVITGVYRAQLETTEKQLIFCRRETLQQMLGVGGDVSEFSIVLPAAEESPAVARTLRERLPESAFRVLTWREMIPFVGAYLDSMTVYALIWNVIVFVAMAFGLVNSVLMAVFERVREFGLVRALGITPFGILGGVVLETACLLVVGAAGGSLLAAVTVETLGRTGIDFSAFSAGTEYFGLARIVYPEAAAGDYALAGGAVFVLGLLVSLYPAVKAARITPVAAMAHV